MDTRKVLITAAVICLPVAGALADGKPNGTDATDAAVDASAPETARA
jgi:hypothetical protein